MIKLNNNTPQQTQQLVDLLNSRIQASPLILELLYKPYKPNSLFDFESYSKLLSLLDKIGWIEHTSDWDLILGIQLKDGTQIETPEGYFLFEVDQANGDLIIEWPDDEEIPAPLRKGEYKAKLSIDLIEALLVYEG